MCDNAIATGDPNTVPDIALRITPDFRGSEYTRLNGSNSDTKFQVR